MEIAIALLQSYSFDLGGYTTGDLMRAWGRFKPEWVRQAVIESLFQGRYKAISVNQILQLWERKGTSAYHYNREFERLVCGDVAVAYDGNAEISPSSSEIIASKTSNDRSIPFPRRSMFDTLKSSSNSQPDTQRSPLRKVTPSGTTPSQFYPEQLKPDHSQVYRSAYANMTLLAESSLFVDKLRSMCGDHPDRTKQASDNNYIPDAHQSNPALSL